MAGWGELGELLKYGPSSQVFSLQMGCPAQKQEWGVSPVTHETQRCFYNLFLNIL